MQMCKKGTVPFLHIERGDSMRIDKLAMTSREALQNAIGIASDAQAASVEPIHLLAALLTGGERNLSLIHIFRRAIGWAAKCCVPLWSP